MMARAYVHKQFLLGIVGSRTFDDYELLCEWVKRLERPTRRVETIVSGGARGADSLAERYAKEFDKGILVFDPHWQLEGRNAGIIRNKRIVNASSELLAFWDGKSRGTAHSIDFAKKKGIPVHVVNFIEENDELSTLQN